MVLTGPYQFADFDYTISYSELKKIIKNEEFRKRLEGAFQHMRDYRFQRELKDAENFRPRKKLCE